MVSKKEAAKKSPTENVEDSTINAEVATTKMVDNDLPSEAVMDENMEMSKSIDTHDNNQDQLTDEGLGAYDKNNFSLGSLDDKYVNMQGCIKALDIAFLTRKNIVLFGKGGHGKSELKT